MSRIYEVKEQSSDSEAVGAAVKGRAGNTP